jgi:ACS family hexuronate transporter-like MFS transporter
VLVSSLVIGSLVATMGYAPVFVGLPLLDVVGAVVLWTFVREPMSIPVRHPEQREGSALPQAASSLT